MIGRSGSVVADLALKFDASVKDPLKKLKDLIKKGKFAGLVVDPSFLKVYNAKGRLPISLIEINELALSSYNRIWHLWHKLCTYIRRQLYENIFKDLSLHLQLNPDNSNPR